MASTHQYKSFGQDVKKVHWSEVVTGKIVNVYSNNTADITVAGVGAVSAVPIFYHCENSGTVDNGYQAFATNDDILVLAEKDAPDATPSYTVVGFTSGRKPCGQKIYIYCEMSYRAQRYCSVFDVSTNAVATDIPTNGGGTAAFPTEPDNISDWIATANVDGGEQLFNASGIAQSSGPWEGDPGPPGNWDMAVGACPGGGLLARQSMEKTIYNVDGGTVVKTTTMDRECATSDYEDPHTPSGTSCCVRPGHDCALGTYNSSYDYFHRRENGHRGTHVRRGNWLWAGLKLDYRHGFLGYTSTYVDYDDTYYKRNSFGEGYKTFGGVEPNGCSSPPADRLYVTDYHRESDIFTERYRFANWLFYTPWGEVTLPEYNLMGGGVSHVHRINDNGAITQTESGESYRINYWLGFYGFSGGRSRYFLNTARPTATAVIQIFDIPEISRRHTQRERENGGAWTSTTDNEISPAQFLAGIAFPVAPGDDPATALAQYDPHTMSRNGNFEAFLKTLFDAAVGTQDPPASGGWQPTVGMDALRLITA